MMNTEEWREKLMARGSPDKIEEGLYLGNAAMAAEENEDRLLAMGITHILAVIETGAMQVQYKKIQRLQVDVEDATTTSIAVHFPTCFDFITKAQAGGGVVFVHCASGCSRSPTMVTAYLMQKNRWTVDRALRHVQQHRRQAKPNRSFIQQLMDYERTLMLLPEEVEQTTSTSTTTM